MFKSGIKNYFINLKYYFTPVGVLAVGMILGVSILIPGALAAFSGFGERLSEILGEGSIDLNPAKDYIVNSVTSLDWSDPITALKTMISREWFEGTVKESFNLISAELANYSAPIEEAFAAMVAILIALVFVFFFFTFAGFVCGYFLTRFLVRRNMARRGVWKFILAAVIDSLLFAGLCFLCIWLAALWKPSVYISAAIALFLLPCLSLIEAYLVHGYKKVNRKEVLNFTNVLKLIAADAAVLVISLAFLAISVLLTNALAGAFIGFAFVEIALIVISLNAEGYVKGLAVKPLEEQLPLAA